VVLLSIAGKTFKHERFDQRIQELLSKVEAPPLDQFDFDQFRRLVRLPPRERAH